MSSSLCVLVFVADLSKWYGQWRPEFLDSLQLEENQEYTEDEELARNGAQYQDEPTVDLIRLEGDEP